MTEQFSNAAQTTLNGGIGSGDLSLVVASAANFPGSGNFRILIESEILVVTGVAGTTFTVLRAQEGTSAISHPSGAAVTGILTAGALAQLKADTFTAGGDLTGTGTSQTIASLAVTDGKVAVANKDGAAGTPSMRTLGTGSSQACAGNDSRLSDSRAPTAHNTSHKHGGSDEVATATAGANAIPKAGGGGTLDIGWLPTDGRIAAVPNLGASAVANGATSYMMPDLLTAAATEVAAFLCTKAGTLRDLFVFLGTGPTTSESIVFTIRKNGVDTGLTVTISNPAVSGSDTTNTVTVAAGDKITLKAVASTNGAVADVIASFNYVV